MLYVGSEEGEHYVIHNSLEAFTNKKTKINLLRVAVTPLKSFYGQDGRSFWDKLTILLQPKGVDNDDLQPSHD